MNILVSACLIGLSCRYDGRSETAINTLCTDTYTLIPVCPEQLGGLPTPRAPAEISGNEVINRSGDKVTSAFYKGAEETLKTALLYGCKYAILKERSPSCGSGKIYDGSFSGKLIDGYGITAKILEENGIKVIGESEAEDFLRKL